jgi:hypothetical protein
MKKNDILIYVSILLAVLAFNPNILYADNTPYPKDNPKGELDPNEVYVYTDAGYLGYEKCWEVKPGQRYVLVDKLPPEFTKTISSIRMNHWINLIIFQDAYFAGSRLWITGSIADLNEAIVEEGWIKHEYTEDVKSCNDNIASIIIMRKDVGYLGVTLFESQFGDFIGGFKQLFLYLNPGNCIRQKKLPLNKNG